MGRPFYNQLAISLIIIFFAFQTTMATIRTYLPEKEACPGQLTLVPVNVENLIGVDSFHIVFTYNPAIITYGGFENIHPDLAQGNFTISHISGQLSMVYYSSIPLSVGADTLVFFRFTPIEGHTLLDWNLLLSNYFYDGVPVSSIFDSGSISVLPRINISMVQIPEEVCPGSFDASIIATVSGGTPPYVYQWIGSPIQVLSDSIASNLAADGSYTLRITDSKGCVYDTIVTVKTRKLNEIEITASPDTVFISNPTVVFTAENLSDPFITNYLWRFGDGDSVNTPLATIPHIYFNAKEFAEEGGQEYTVTLTVTNEFGCDTTLTYTIPLREAPIFVPNVFTPNGDGANDFFKIVRDDDRTKIITNEYLSLDLVVFNRWGRKMFSSNNYKSDWDGGNAPDGVYFYVLKATGFFKIDTFRGAVHILR